LGVFNLMTFYVGLKGKILTTEMRGFLKGLDNSCILLSSLYPVTIGRDVNCDLVLKVGSLSVWTNDRLVYFR